MKRISKLSVLATGTFLAACNAPQPFGEFPQGSGDPVSYNLQAVAKLTPVGVTVDSVSAGFPGTNIVDGNLATHWDNGGFKNATATATLDLGASASLANVQVKTGTATAGTSFDLQVSADGTTFTNALAGQAGTNFANVTKTLPAGTTGRYVRLLWHNTPGNTVAHFSLYELTVNGTAGAAPPPVIPPVVPPVVCPPPATGGGGTVTPPTLPTALGPFTILAQAVTALNQPVRSRVRFDIPGDAVAPTPTIDALQTAALASTMGVTMTATCDVRPAGSATSLIPTGAFTVPLTQPIPAEAGVVLGTSPQGHIAQVTWPVPAGLGAGAPILRIQLAGLPVATGTVVDLFYTLVAVDPVTNTTTTWVQNVPNITVQ